MRLRQKSQPLLPIRMLILGCAPKADSTIIPFVIPIATSAAYKQDT